MKANYIELKKERELGEIISDTFLFLRHNYKVLLKLILKITWPALFFVLVSFGYYFWSWNGDLFSSYININSMNNLDFTGFLAVIIMIIAISVYYALLHGTVLGAMKSYAENKGEIMEEAVEWEVRSKFWKLWGGNILVGILTFFGILLCIIPGIYLMVPLSLITSVIIFQNKGVMDAFAECFQLIKNNWWITFATILIIGILFYIINFVLQLPLTIYVLSKVFVENPDGIVDSDGVMNWIVISLNLLFTLLQYILFSIIVISLGFIYFNLNEKKYHTGTFEEIDNLGKH